MERRALTIPALFTLAGAGFGICVGMTFFTNKDDPGRVQLPVSVPLATFGALVGIAAFRLLVLICERYRAFEILIIPVGATLLGLSAGMSLGWAMSDRLTGTIADRQEATSTGMRAGGCIGATLGLVASVVQFLFDRIQSKRIRSAVVVIGATLFLAFSGAALGYSIGRADGKHFKEQLWEGPSPMNIGAVGGAMIGFWVALLGIFYEDVRQPNPRKD